MFFDKAPAKSTRLHASLVQAWPRPPKTPPHPLLVKPASKNKTQPCAAPALMPG